MKRIKLSSIYGNESYPSGDWNEIFSATGEMPYYYNRISIESAVSQCEKPNQIIEWERYALRQNYFPQRSLFPHRSPNNCWKYSPRHSRSPSCRSRLPSPRRHWSPRLSRSPCRSRFSPVKCHRSHHHSRSSLPPRSSQISFSCSRSPVKRHSYSLHQSSPPRKLRQKLLPSNYFPQKRHPSFLRSPNNYWKFSPRHRRSPSCRSRSPPPKRQKSSHHRGSLSHRSCSSPAKYQRSHHHSRSSPLPKSCEIRRSYSRSRYPVKRHSSRLHRRSPPRKPRQKPLPSSHTPQRQHPSSTRNTSHFQSHNIFVDETRSQSRRNRSPSPKQCRLSCHRRSLTRRSRFSPAKYHRSHHHSRSSPPTRSRELRKSYYHSRYPIKRHPPTLHQRSPPTKTRQKPLPSSHSPQRLHPSLPRNTSHCPQHNNFADKPKSSHGSRSQSSKIKSHCRVHSPVNDNKTSSVSKNKPPAKKKSSLPAGCKSSPHRRLSPRECNSPMKERSPLKKSSLHHNCSLPRSKPMSHSSQKSHSPIKRRQFPCRSPNSCWKYSPRHNKSPSHRSKSPPPRQHRSLHHSGSPSCKSCFRPTKYHMSHHHSQSPPQPRSHQMRRGYSCPRSIKRHSPSLHQRSSPRQKPLSSSQSPQRYKLSPDWLECLGSPLKDNIFFVVFELNEDSVSSEPSKAKDEVKQIVCIEQSTAAKDEPTDQDHKSNDMAINSETKIDDLPNEILLKIFEYLTHNELAYIARVCKKWNSFIKYPGLWKKVNVSFNLRHRCQNTVSKLLCESLPTYVTHLKLNFRCEMWEDTLNFEEFCVRFGGKCPFLEVLIIYYAVFSVDLLSALDLCKRYFSELRVISFHNSAFPNNSLNYSLSSSFSNIKVLDFSKNHGIGTFSNLSFTLKWLSSGIPFLKNLKFLHMHDPLPISSSIFQALKDHALKLTDLLLCWADLRDKDLKFNESVFPELKTICLRSCKMITCKGIISLIRSCKSLQNVYVKQSIFESYVHHPFVLENQSKLQIVKVTAMCMRLSFK